MSSPTADTKYTVQHIANRSYDEALEVQTFELVEFSGSTLSRSVSKDVALKVTTVSTTTYVAKAAIGSAQSAAVWQVKKIDSSSGVVITWADSGNFSQVATDLTFLSYN